MQGSSALGLILRSACETADDDEIAQDIRQMTELALQVLGDENGEGAEKLVEGARRSGGPFVMDVDRDVVTQRLG